MTTTAAKKKDPQVLMPAPQERAPRGIVARLANLYDMDPGKFADTVKATVFPKGNATNEQLAALCMVAEQYKLNPLLKEVHAFPNGSGIVPVVGVDGWISMMNRERTFDGIEFEDRLDDAGKLVSITATIHRTDREHPIRVTEYLAENLRPTDPWKKMPARMLRHRALIQAARIAFGFSGIYDPDEAQVVAGARDSDYQVVDRQPAQVEAAVADLDAALADEPAPTADPAEVIDPETGEVVTFGDAAAREPGCDDDAPWPAQEVSGA